jgi:AcrR family transcriptional regulator
LTRERLLEAASAAVADKGFGATSLDEIAARAGLTKGAIYGIFANKEELFLALLRRSPPGGAWPTESHGTPRERLRDLARRAMEENESARRLAPLRAEFLLYSLTRPEVRAWVAGQMVEQLDRTEAKIRILFRPEELILPPRELAILLENFVPSLAYTRAWAPDAISAESVAAIFESFARE